MTVALESFHQSPVSVEALDEWRDEASYARTSLLSRQSDGAVVQFGIMRIWLTDLPAAAKRRSRASKAPLGRVLIEHNVLREVELITLWQIDAGPRTAASICSSTARRQSYGRSAQILVDERPTVQLLEIVKLPYEDSTDDTEITEMPRTKNAYLSHLSIFMLTCQCVDLW